MKLGPDTHTLSITEEGKGPESLAEGPHLFLVIEGRCPSSPPLRVALAHVDEVTVGRGERGASLAGRRAHLRISDPWMSSAHARFSRLARRWTVEDTQSKNGLRVNGEAAGQRELDDGDVIEVGHTFFLFRDAMPCSAGAPAILDHAARPRGPFAPTLIPAFEALLADLALVAGAGVSVLIEGETGTGKEVIAKAIHDLSARPGAFVAVNCGALPQALVEGELFGHKRGAFSGAGEDRTGLVRAADKGTLLLDEIGDLPEPSQAALLRVLQEGEVRPIGGTRPIPVDLRVIAATHRSVERLVEEGKFRRDLFARLAGHRVTLPPLRERREDMGLLVSALLARASVGGELPSLQPRTVRAMLGYAWPGNVRELEKAMATAVVLARGGPLEPKHLPEVVARAGDARDEGEEDALRRDELDSLLREHKGNVTKVARAMGKARMQVQRWIKRYQLDAEQYRR